MIKRGQLTRDSIIESALILASTKGMNALTYNGLAREVGIKPQSMYRYVKDIEDVKAGTLAKYIKLMVTYVRQKTDGLDGVAALETGIFAFISYTHEGLAFQDLVGVLSEYGSNQLIHEAFHELNTFFSHLIRNCCSLSNQAQQYEQLILDYIVGYITLVHVGISTPQNNAAIFKKNIALLTAMLKS